MYSCVGHACGGSVRNCVTLQLKAQLRRYAPLHLKPALNNGNVYIYTEFTLNVGLKKQHLEGWLSDTLQQGHS